MLNYGKSDLVKVSPKFGEETFELDARLSFRKNEDGSIGLVPHFIRKEQKLDEYKGHKFSEEDKKNLKATGNMGRVIDLVDKETGEIIPSYISIDRKTSALTARRTKSPMSLPARYAYRKESERRKSPNRSRKCSVRGCR